MKEGTNSNGAALFLLRPRVSSEYIRLEPEMLYEQRELVDLAGQVCTRDSPALLYAHDDSSELYPRRFADGRRTP